MKLDSSVKYHVEREAFSEKSEEMQTRLLAPLDSGTFSLDGVGARPRKASAPHLDLVDNEHTSLERTMDDPFFQMQDDNSEDIDDDNPDEVFHAKPMIRHLAQDVSAMMIHYRLDDVRELALLLRCYNREIDEHYAKKMALSQQLMQKWSSPRGTNARDEEGGEAETEDVAVPAVPNKEGAVVARQELFSFRQLSSWKLSIQKAQEQVAAEKKAQREEETRNSIFSMKPLDRDDWAEIRLQDSEFATEAQIRANKYIQLFERSQAWVLGCSAVLRFIAAAIYLFRAAFVVPEDRTAYICQLIFLDVPLALLCLSRAFSVQESYGVLTVNFSRSLRKYILSTSFLLDVCGIFPLEIVGLLRHESTTAYFHESAYVIPAYRLNKLLLCRGVFDDFSDWLDMLSAGDWFHPAVGRITFTWIQAVTVMHVGACACSAVLLTEPEMNELWFKLPELENSTARFRYLHTLDMSSKSFIGYMKGDAFNVSDAATVVMLLLCFAGVWLVSTLIAAVESFMERPGHEHHFYESIDKLFDEASNLGISPTLREEAAFHLHHVHQSAKHSDAPYQTLGGLPKNLQIRVLQHVGREIISKVSLLAPEANNKNFVLCMAISLVPQVLAPYTVLFRKGDRGDSMGFITHGSLGVVPDAFEKTHDERTVLFVLKTGSFYGEIALILGVRRTATVSSLSRYANLLVLHKANFLQIASDFPSAVRRMRLEAQARLAALNSGVSGLNIARSSALLASTKKLLLTARFVTWIQFIHNFKVLKGSPSTTDLTMRQQTTSTAELSSSANGVQDVDDGVASPPRDSISLLRSLDVDAKAQPVAPLHHTHAVVSQLSDDYPHQSPLISPALQVDHEHEDLVYMTTGDNFCEPIFKSSSESEDGGNEAAQRRSRRKSRRRSTGAHIVQLNTNNNSKSGEEVIRKRTFVAKLCNEVSRLMTRYRAETVYDLAVLIRINRREILKNYVTYQKADFAALSANNIRSGMYNTCSLVFENDGEQSGSRAFQAEQSWVSLQQSFSSESRQLISFRQLASWKIALKNWTEREKKEEINRRWANSSESIFTDIPPERSDWCELRLSPDECCTEDQRRNSRIVDLIGSYSLIVTFYLFITEIVLFFILTFRISFEVVYNPAAYALELVFLDLPLLVYACSRFFALVEKKGKFYWDWRTAARMHVLSAGFVLDLIGAFPLETIAFGINDNCTRFQGICGFLDPAWRGNRIFLCRHVIQHASYLIDEASVRLGFSPSVGRIVYQTLSFCLVAHCGVCVSSVYVLWQPDLVEEWLHAESLPNLRFKYLYLFDWATKTIVGQLFGNTFDIPDELIAYILVFDFISIFVISAFIGAVMSLMMRPSLWSRTTRSIDILRDEWDRQMVPNELQEEIVSFKWYQHDTNTLHDDTAKSLHDLPKNLQMRVLHHIGKEMIKKVPLLAPEAANENFVLCMSISLVPQVLAPYTVLFRKGDRGDSMGFITHGSLGVVPDAFEKTHDERTVLFVLKTGSFYGEIALILGVRRTATVSSLSRYANLLVLHKANFLQIASDFPSAVRRMRLEAQARLAALNTNQIKEERMKKLKISTNSILATFYYRLWKECAHRRRHPNPKSDRSGSIIGSAFSEGGRNLSNAVLHNRELQVTALWNLVRVHRQNSTLALKESKTFDDSEASNTAELSPASASGNRGLPQPASSDDELPGQVEPESDEE